MLLPNNFFIIICTPYLYTNSPLTTTFKLSGLFGNLSKHGRCISGSDLLRTHCAHSPNNYVHDLIRMGDVNPVEETEEDCYAVCVP